MVVGGSGRTNNGRELTPSAACPARLNLARHPLDYSNHPFSDRDILVASQESKWAADGSAERMEGYLSHACFVRLPDHTSLVGSLLS